MGITLLVCGQRDPATTPSDADMTAVADMARQTRNFIVRRCGSPGTLVDIVAEVAKENGPVDILDLYDHGDIGRQRMGNDILFSTDNDPASDLHGAEIAIQLQSYLSETAQVRLLGCVTVAPMHDRMVGRLLAIKLARMLGGHRVAFGTINSVTVINDFRTTGFNRDVEETMLFSSLGALDSFPPAPPDREAHILDIRRPPGANAANPEAKIKIPVGPGIAPANLLVPEVDWSTPVSSQHDS